MAGKKTTGSPGKHETKFQERTGEETLFFVMTRMDMHLILRRISKMINVLTFCHNMLLLAMILVLLVVVCMIYALLI